jgi:hypothetical protein
MSVRTPVLCALNFDAEKGDTVEWKNPAVDCIVSQAGTDTFPFISDPPSNGNSININPAPPTPKPSVIVDVDASTTPYTYEISCCLQGNPVHTVTVTDSLSRHKKR